MQFNFSIPLFSLSFIGLTFICGAAIPTQANSLNSDSDHKQSLLLAQDTTEQTVPWSKNWDDYPDISNNFTKGCIGDVSGVSESQRLTRNDYCDCALKAYQSRYTPELFSLINLYATEAGQLGPSLVNLMMEPELNTCAVTTGFER